LKLALECPISMMDRLQPYGDFDFMLTHLFKSKEYKDFYVRSSRFKILDNSTNELGEPCSEEEILKVAEIVNPNFICPPDYLGDQDRTLEALESMEKSCPVSCILPIVQGSDINSVLYAAHVLKSKGYSKVAVPYDITGNRSLELHELASLRVKIVWNLAKMFDWIHLLGLTDPHELISYRDLSCVRSLDTGSPITNGLKGLRYGKDSPLTKKEMLDFGSLELNPYTERAVLHNLNCVRKFMTESDKWIS